MIMRHRPTRLYVNCAKSRLQYIQRKPIKILRVIPCKASIHDLETISYFVGKSIILYTMFYCSLNWLHYRSQRKQDEDKED